MLEAWQAHLEPAQAQVAGAVQPEALQPLQRVQSMAARAGVALPRQQLRLLAVVRSTVAQAAARAGVSHPKVLTVSLAQVETSEFILPGEVEPME